jgi:hypothetical protein
MYTGNKNCIPAKAYVDASQKDSLPFVGWGEIAPCSRKESNHFHIKKKEVGSNEF